MFSAKTIVAVGISALFTAVIGFVLALKGVEWGRYIIYGSVPIGAIVILFGALAASQGAVKDDLQRSEPNSPPRKPHNGERE